MKHTLKALVKLSSHLLLLLSELSVNEPASFCEDQAFLNRSDKMIGMSQQHFWNMAKSYVNFVSSISRNIIGNNSHTF